MASPSRRDGTFSLVVDKGWKRFKDATDVQKFKNKFYRKRKKALDQVARVIISGALTEDFEVNAALTTFIKGDAGPLKGTKNRLEKALTTHIVNRQSIFVGVKNTHKFFPQAVAIHEGSRFEVSEAMRNMFILLWQVSEGKRDSSALSGRAKELWDLKSGGWKPISSATTEIKIPARPFMQRIFQNEEVQKEVLDIFARTVDEVIKEMIK